MDFMYGVEVGRYGMVCMYSVCMYGYITIYIFMGGWVDRWIVKYLVRAYKMLRGRGRGREGKRKGKMVSFRVDGWDVLYIWNNLLI